MSEMAVRNEVQIAGLRDKIREAHNEFIGSMKLTMDAGIRAGELLIELKGQLEHGEFIGWIQENLPFTERTAQKYMRIARNQDKLEQKGARLLSEAYNAVNENSKKDYKKVYRENDEIINDDDSFGDINDDFISQNDEKILKAPEESKEKVADHSLYWYWDDVQRLISGMNSVYRKLASKRNSQTPKSVGHMIGNIREMAERLESWDPDVMGDCDECNGDGVIAVQNSHGDVEHVECPYCINGKTGLFKVTKK